MEKLYTNIFGDQKTGLEKQSFLQSITDTNLYFGLSNFFLLKNTNQQANNYNSITAKTALFFSNPFYLQSLLNNEQEQIVETDIAVENTSNTNTQVAVSNAGSDTKKQEEELIFEPLFASDYFASQGIKLSAEQLADDKLGKQLKSFTSWLKTMKKVHPDKLPIVSKLVEEQIQSLAAVSNKEEDIITEAMAEAFALQHKPLKAIDLYKKLSLLNPAKSVYFAAKIESLKN
ncbi:MAG: hypothetical protein ABL929_07875 [Ferruginibacter sp.]|nr:hypothetical protein [Ferruginibacter sp.]